MRIPFDNSYFRELDGLYAPWEPSGSSDPRLLQLNEGLARELGLDPEALSRAEGLAYWSGNVVPPGAEPLAQAYAGHQFGGFSPQLGDGRALLLGELIDATGGRRDLALKGSGRTPFSRGGDGKSALGPVLREYLTGEAMHALGIPTTRALAAVATGEDVLRGEPEPGGILTRVAASHIRVGTFEFFAARGDDRKLSRLADYAIARHDPGFADQPDKYMRFLDAVVDRQASLIARWMGVGFIHGVMNTDNMTVSGETIDYGPCAFLELYDPNAVFSSIDTRGRYAFGNQPTIAQWNLARLAETLLPLIDDDVRRAADLASASVDSFSSRYKEHRRAVFEAKLGLSSAPADMDDLATEYLELLQRHEVDFTLGFRSLADAALGEESRLLMLFGGAVPSLASWLKRWQIAGRGINLEERARSIRHANPLYIARNHLVEAALDAAVQNNDMGPFETLLRVVRTPFDERPADAAYASPGPSAFTASYRTFCGT